MNGRDIRLVPAAVLAWATTWLVLALDANITLLVAVLPLAGAVVAWRRMRQPPRFRARHRSVVPWNVAATVAFTLAVLSAVIIATAGHQHARAHGLLGALSDHGAVVTLTAMVRSDPLPVATTRWDTAPRYRLIVDAIRVSGRGQHGSSAAPVLVLGDTTWTEVAVGQQVRATGRLTAAQPGQDVHAVLSTHRPPDIRAPPPAHHQVANAMRGGLLSAVQGRSGQARGLVPGIAVGDDSQLPPDLQAAMKTVSLTHITAVSGTHLSIILGAVLGAMQWSPRWLRGLIAGPLLLGFVILVRPEPSVLRAAVMAAVAIAALLVGRPSRALPALAATVIVLLFVDPWLARTFGFALSVLATAGILIHAAPIARVVGRLLPRWAAMACAIPAAAQLWCAPVIVLLTPAIATYAVPANVLAAPLVIPATILGVLATVISPWWPAATAVLVTLASAATAGIAAIAQFFAGLPLANFPWPPAAGGALLLAGLTVWGMVAAPRRGSAGARGPARWGRRGVVGAVLLFLTLPGPRGVVANHVWGAAVPRDWVAAQCDVGQGSAFVVRSADDAALLIDTGAPQTGIDRCLRRLGVHRIELLVLTHLHLDHVGALAEVLDGREVDRVLLSPHDSPRAAETEVLDLLAAGPQVERPTAGLRGSSGRLDWEVLWPTGRAMERASPGDETAANDLSLVLLVDAGELRFLALGDLEDAGQRGLLGAPGQLAADVVVVAHHGSPRQVAELATAIDASLAVISVGDNDYGHPAQRTIDLYGAAGGLVLRTDHCGDIWLTHRRQVLQAHSGCSAENG